LGLGVWIASALRDPFFGIAAGIGTMLLFEIFENNVEKRRLRHIGESQTLRLQDASMHIQRLDSILQRQSGELSNALHEIERRDSVGAPEARKLIESQRVTLQAQSNAMEEAKKLIGSQEKMLKQLEVNTEDARGRWEDMVETMERVLKIQAEHADVAHRRLADESGRLSDAFAENNREMQRTMTELLQQLALEPRTSNVSVQDSVVMNSNAHASAEEAVRIVVGPHLKKRSSRKTPHIPVVKLKARPLGKKSEQWVDAFNEDLI
jgi:hypothetical protein